MSIKLLLTGGTIDKHYNESNGELSFETTHIPDLLNLGRCKAEIVIEEVMLKDSLEMNDSDRQLILEACQGSKQDKVLITHGTDTMVETAEVIAAADMEKTVVLVGAMVPYEFKHSDGMFNVGFAVACVQTLPAGVYVAMNGKVFDWDSVVKNREKGAFEATN